MACSASRVIPILPVAAPRPVRPTAPELRGPQARIARVLGELAPSLQAAFGRPVEPGEWLQALELGDGEATVQLRRDLGCHAREVAGTAFDTLRRLLPDTDIYVGL